jgi:histidinol-phosphate aminotransferase
MNKVRQPFNVNSLAQAAAIEALRDDNHVKKVKQMNTRGKKFLYRELKNLGVTFVPSEANFIYVVVGENDAERVYNKMLKLGVIVRPMGPNSIRITVGLQGENKKLVHALGKAIT